MSARPRSKTRATWLTLLGGTFVRVKGGLAVLSLVKGVPRAFGRMLNGQPLAANTQDVLAGGKAFKY